MTAGRTSALGGAFVVLIVLHYTLRPVLAWRAPVDFLTIALLLVAANARPGVSAFVGFGLGLVADSLTPGAFGSAALAMTVVGFGASWLKAAFFADNLALNAVFVFVGKWMFDVIYLVAERRLQGLDLFTQMVVWSPLAAGVTAAAGLAVLFAVRPTLGVPRA